MIYHRKGIEKIFQKIYSFPIRREQWHHHRSRNSNIPVFSGTLRSIVRCGCFMRNIIYLPVHWRKDIHLGIIKTLILLRSSHYSRLFRGWNTPYIAQIHLSGCSLHIYVRNVDSRQKCHMSLERGSLHLLHSQSATVYCIYISLQEAILCEL